MLSPNARLWQEAAYLSLGLVALAAVTGLYFWLDWPLVSAGFTYLIVVVLLSLVSSFSCLIALSFIAVGCLNYFFTQPIFSFRVDYQQDINALVAFFITSLITSGLVSRLRTEQREHMLAVETLRETQAQLTHLDRLATTGQLTASIVH